MADKPTERLTTSEDRGDGSDELLRVGLEFSSYEDLCSAIKTYERLHFVTLYKRSSRTIQAAIKRAPNRHFADQLVYSELDFACVHGGRDYISRSKGKRKAQSTFLMECPFHIKLRATLNGTKLYVKEMNSEHNHELSKEIYMHMPKQRRLDPETQKEVAEILQLKPNKKLVQNHLVCLTGKPVILKDLHNLSAKTTKGCDFRELITEMQKVKDAEITTFVDDENTVQAIYFQTVEMRSMFMSYPEVLFIDATYKLNDLRMPLYVLMAIDGNGESEIVCLWIVQSEDRSTLTSLFVEFKKHNESSSLIQCVMTDKDMTERDVIRQQLPQAGLVICLFHTLRTMRREISCEKLGISQSERFMSLDLVSKMAYARSEEAYLQIYNEFNQCAPKGVLDYFNENWHTICNEWVDGLKNQQCNFMNRTNNRLESINGKLKAVITKYSGMVQFFNDLMQCINSLKLERNHRALQVIMKRRVSTFDTESALGKYMAFLTPFAFDYIKEQFKLSEKVKIAGDIDDCSCKIDSSEGQLVTTVTSCSCTFTKSMKLPCRHILATRRHKGLLEYTEDVCAERWKLHHFFAHHRVFQDNCSYEADDSESEAVVDVISLDQPAPSRILTEQEKYKKAFQVSQSLAQQLSSLGMNEFREGLNILQSIKSSWDEGKKLVVMELDDSHEVRDSDETIQLSDVHDSEGDESPLDVLLDTMRAIDGNTSCDENDQHGENALREQNVELAETNIDNIKMPPKMPKKGRLKGAGLTVIGLPKRRNVKQPSPFVRKSESEKAKVILSWFVEEDIANTAMHSNVLIEEHDVEARPECIPMKCLDENVCVSMVKKYFTIDAWMVVQNVMEVMQARRKWDCAACSLLLSTNESVACESCLNWFHLKCVGLKKAPKKKNWFCITCYKT